MDQGIGPSASSANSSRTVMARSDNLRIHQDVGVDGLRASATVHQIEEFVAIQQVDSGPLLRLPTAQLELERSPRFLLHKRLPKKLVGDVVKRAAFPRRFLLEPLQEIVVEPRAMSSSP